MFDKFLRGRSATHDEKDEARALRRDFMEYIYEPGIEDFELELMQDYWMRLEAFNQGEDGVLSRLQRGMVWGEWRQELEQQSRPYKIGDAQCMMIYPKLDPTTIHEYNRKPARLKWPLLEIEQNDTRFYLATAPIKEIDAVCAVPDLPNSENSSNSARRVLDPNEGVNEWQRQLNLKNRDAIMNFMNISTNIIANAPILFISDDEHISIEGSKLFISMDFLKKTTLRNPPRDVYRDVLTDLGDLRPLWLIDGQHRIRGGAGSELGREQNIPLIIFPSEMSLQRTAKIFAEINTLQRPLDVLHQTFMQHRFKIESKNPKADFVVDLEGNPANDNSRANNIAYELAARCVSDPHNPLYERIKIFDQNPGNNYVVDSRKWVDFTRMWMKDIYTKSENYNLDNIYLEVGNYFQAIKQLSGSSWPDTPPRSLLQQKSPFIVLLLCFQAVRDKAILCFMERTDELPNHENPLQVLDFATAMAPWQNVDWRNATVLDTFRRGGERPRRSLLAWLVDALLADEPAMPREILTDGIQSVAGQGIFAKPELSNAVIEGDGWIDRPGQKLHVHSQRPLNALPTCQWALFYRDFEIESKTSIAGQNGRAKCVFEHRAEWNVYETLELRTRWENINGGTVGSIELIRG